MFVRRQVLEVRGVSKAHIYVRVSAFVRRTLSPTLSAIYFCSREQMGCSVDLSNTILNILLNSKEHNDGIRMEGFRLDVRLHFFSWIQ